MQVVEPPPPPPPQLAVTLSPSSQTIGVGGTVVFAVSVSGGAAGAASWTCASSDPSKATVSTTSAGCQATAVAAGGVSITAAVTKGGETVNAGAGLTILEDMADPAFLVISSITDSNADDESLIGRVSVTVSVERGDQMLMQLSLLVDGVVAKTLPFGGASAVAAPEDEPAAQATHAFILSFNSAGYNAVTGEPTYMNGEHTISAALMVAGSDEPVGTGVHTVEFENPATVHLALSGLGSGAMNASTGELWYGGPGADLTITAVPVKYTPGAVESVTLLAGICGSAIMTDSEAPYEFKPGCKEEDTVMAANFRLSSGGQSIDVAVNEGSVFPIRLDYKGPVAPHFKVNPNDREEGWINAAVDFVGENGPGSKKDGWLVYNDADADAGVGGYTPQLRFNFADSDVGVALAVPPSQNPVLPPELIGSSSKKDAICVVVSAVDLLGNESKLPKADADCEPFNLYGTEADGETTYAAGLLAGVDLQAPTIEFSPTSPKENDKEMRDFQVHLADEGSGIRETSPLKASVNLRDKDDDEKIKDLKIDIVLPLANTVGLPTSSMGYYTFAATVSDKAGNVSEEATRTALHDTGDPAASTIVGDYDKKKGQFTMVATVTDGLSIKAYWPEARFGTEANLSLSAAGDETDIEITQGLFLPQEGMTAVDAYNAASLTQAHLASALTAKSYRALQASDDDNGSEITDLNSLGVVASDHGGQKSATPPVGTGLAATVTTVDVFDLTASDIDATAAGVGSVEDSDRETFERFTAEVDQSGGDVEVTVKASGRFFVMPVVAVDAVVANPTADPPVVGVDAVAEVTGNEGLRDNPLARIDFYATTETFDIDGEDNANGDDVVLKYIGSVDGSAAGARDFDGGVVIDSDDNDSREYIYTMTISESALADAVGSKGDYTGHIVAFGVKSNEGAALSAPAVMVTIED